MSKEGRKLDNKLAEYVEGQIKCWNCGGYSFTNTRDYCVECDDCGGETDVEAEFEDSKN